MLVKNIMLTAVFLLGAACGIAGIFVYAPWLKWARPFLLILEHVSLVIALALLYWQVRAIHRRRCYLIMALLSVATLSAAVIENAHFCIIKARVLSADNVILKKLGKHIIVGYDDPAEFEQWLALSAVRGVYLAKHNLSGENQESLQQRIARWQILYGANKNSALWVATDQEGGLVSKLTPLLPQQPPLSTVVANQAPGRQAVLAYQYAGQQADGLSAVGVNLNFSPVIDLCAKQAVAFTDLYSRISERCFGVQADTVTTVGAGYSRGLLRHGVMPTLKHFPGIGSLTADSHITAAHISINDNGAASQDLIPFKAISLEMPVWMMVAHVYWDAVDSRQLASLSRPVITGFLREQWGFGGVLITDDLNMGPTYQAPRGIGGAGVDALLAGMDVLLISYDSVQYYKVMYALLNAYQQGQLSDALLDESAQRIDNSQRVMWDLQP